MKKFYLEWKSSFLFLITIFFLALFLRIYKLNSFPIFADEAIYIRWAQVMRAEPTLRFLPLSDGKQPLFMWLVIPFLKLFSDPLIAGRLVSVFSGVGSLVGIYLLSYLLFNSKKAAAASSFLYAISPFAVFFDRMALVDSLLAMFSILFYIFVLLTAKYRRLDTAMIAGFALGGAALTKSPALFFAILSPSFVLFVPFKKGKFLIEYFKFFALLSISLCIGYGFYNILRLGPEFHLINSRTQDYVYPISHLWTSPSDPFKPYMDRILRWIYALGPMTLYLFVGLSILVYRKKFWKELSILFLLFFFPASVAAMFTVAITARYVLYAIIPLYIISGLIFDKLFEKKWKTLLTGLMLITAILSFNFNYKLLSSPLQANLPPGERSGYLVEWSSGIGIKEAAQKLIQIRNDNPEKHLLIGTEGYFGTLPDGLQVYLEGEENITIIGVGLGINEVPSSLVDSKQSGNLTFLVANSSRLKFGRDFSEYGLDVLYSIRKPDREKYTHEWTASGDYDIFYLFEVK